MNSEAILRSTGCGLDLRRIARWLQVSNLAAIQCLDGLGKASISNTVDGVGGLPVDKLNITTLRPVSCLQRTHQGAFVALRLTDNGSAQTRVIESRSDGKSVSFR